VEFLKEIIPTLSRLAVLGDSTIPGYTKVLKETEVAAASYKVQLKYLDVLDVKDIEAALQAAGKQRADGLLTMTSPVLFSRRSQLAALAIKHGLAAIYHQSQYVEAGGLMSYGASFTDMDRRAATYV
jgi:putative tryptophan/tyrosine transport system substrate-binding protein